MTAKKSVTIVQMNDSHAYLDVHQEMFWQGDHAVYRQAWRLCPHCHVNTEIQPNLYYSAAFVTMQGVPQKYGRNRENKPERIIDAMRKYLSNHRPVRAEIMGTFIAV